MSKVVISVENLSKSYRLGQIGTGTFSRDLKVWWARVRGKPNPLLRIGETEHGNQVGEEIWALKGVTFSVEQGEVLGIIGRNGAGKSTLLKILSRVTAPTSGVIKVKGRVASLLEVGTGFHPELTGRENVYLNGAILGMSKQEVNRKFDEIVDFSGVEKFIDTPVKRYSSGMYVRLAFAVAAHLDPEILVVDEVLAVGDAEFQRKCLGKMGEVARGGRTVLFVSHNIGAVKSLCTRALLVSYGKIVSDGNVNEIVETYITATSVKRSSNETLESASRLYSTGEVKFNSIRLMNSLGVESTQLFLGEKFRLLVTIDVSSEIPQAAIEITICSLDGMEIASLRTLDGNDCPIFLAVGKYHIDVDVNVFLLPRAYYILLIVHKFNGAVIDWVERALDFNVLNIAREGSDRYRYWPTMRGYVRASSFWKLERIESKMNNGGNI